MNLIDFKAIFRDRAQNKLCKSILKAKKYSVNSHCKKEDCLGTLSNHIVEKDAAHRQYYW